jgi:hypothetical protein
VPDLSVLAGLALHLQSVQIDAGARFGLAFSRGLTLDLGR